MTEDIIYTLKWKYFSPNVKSRVSDVIKDQSFCDVTLVSDDQKPFKAHRYVLSTDMQKRTTQGRGNFLIIAEISSTNPTKWSFSIKTRPVSCWNWQSKVYFVNLKVEMYNLLLSVKFLSNILRKLLKIPRSGRGRKQTFSMSGRGSAELQTVSECSRCYWAGIWCHHF